MLYGSEEQIKFTLGQAQDYAESTGIKLIFGAMVGSVSKGIHYIDSDYDTRFLYLRKDFPEFTCIPSEMTEDQLVKRLYLKNNVIEWIPFWEATSFLQFLIHPSFSNDFSVGLYNTVGWTFMSPYVWDPYGLQSKIIPLINRIFRADYKIAAQKDIIERNKKFLDCGQGIAKQCLSAVHAAATIEWCLKYKEHPPVDLQTLLQGLERDRIWKDSAAMLEKVRQAVRIAWEDGVSDLKSLHLSICVDYPPAPLAYINKMEKRAEFIKCSETPNPEYANAVVKRIYDIIYRSVYQNEPLCYKVSPNSASCSR